MFFIGEVPLYARAERQVSNPGPPEEPDAYSIRKVDVRLPGNENSHGAMPVHLIITMIKWIRPDQQVVNTELSLWRPPVLLTSLVPPTPLEPLTMLRVVL